MAWPRTDVDRFLLAKLEPSGLKPGSDADRATLLRRVTFDLTGLPPTPEEVDSFLKDGSSSAYSRVVDRLLTSPRFGERCGVICVKRGERITGRHFLAQLHEAADSHRRIHRVAHCFGRS